MNKMKPFSKLFSSIVTSSIWTEDAETRVVWVTMLAICDSDGDVWASVGGLAKAAGVSRDACAAALAKFLAPDHDSRTKEYEGRRIEEIDGGWRLLNYRKYRELGRTEDRREYFAAKKRESRATMSKHVHKCPQLSTKSPIAEAEADAEVEAAAIAALESERPATATSEDPFSVDSKKNDQRSASSVPMVRNFGDWRISVGLRVWVDKTELTEWHALWEAEGWESMTRGYKILCDKIEIPKKIHLSHFLEIRK